MIAPVPALTALLPQQYSQSTRLRTLIQRINARFDEAVGELDYVQLSMHIDTAEGAWLDYIGQRLGLARSLVVDEAVQYWGFDTGDRQTNLGFDLGPILSASGEVSQLGINDITYRRLLKTRALRLTSLSTAAGIQACADSLFQGAILHDLHSTGQYPVGSNGMYNQALVVSGTGDAPLFYLAVPIKDLLFPVPLHNRLELVGPTVSVRAYAGSLGEENLLFHRPATVIDPFNLQFDVSEFVGPFHFAPATLQQLHFLAPSLPGYKIEIQMSNSNDAGVPAGFVALTPGSLYGHEHRWTNTRYRLSEDIVADYWLRPILRSS